MNVVVSGCTLIKTKINMIYFQAKQCEIIRSRFNVIIVKVNYTSYATTMIENNKGLKGYLPNVRIY